MKKISLITGTLVLLVALVSCKDKRDTGRAYMPDMTDSRAYETYTPTGERLKNSAAHGASYNGRPVEGTVARGDLGLYRLKNDSTGYQLSASVTSPLEAGSINMKEAERLYLINCGICHGTKLDGNGPLYNGGDGPYAAKPATLVGDAAYESMPIGRMFHSVTYGKGAMGPYSSQLTTKQRWMVVTYVKSKQNGGKGAATTDSTAAPAAKLDSTATTMLKK
jgi:mono/diheme cytochrome c family protein